MRIEISAGGVVYKKAGSKTFWLICKHSGYHQWAFPKGLIEAHEDKAAAALREVKEETGIRANIVSEIPEPERYTYTFNDERVSKTVHYFLMEYESGDTTDHDWEMEDVQWVTAEEAEKLLHFDGAKKTFKHAVALLSARKS